MSARYSQADTSALAIPAESPAPWTCKCETYWLLLWLKSPLAAGIYHPLDAPPPKTAEDDFKGGIGMIQIVRYFETPVGPYDELLIIPGNYNVPGGDLKGRSRPRISRIYVSQKQTCYNGRKNWNIPKHLARFEFSTPPVTKNSAKPQPLKLAVYPDSSDDSTPPFFAATLFPWRWVPGMPFSTKYLPVSTYLVQPPCNSSIDPWLPGTSTWKGFDISACSAKARLMWVNVDDATAEDKKNGGNWPSVRPWIFGLWLENTTLSIPESDEFDVLP